MNDTLHGPGSYPNEKHTRAHKRIRHLSTRAVCALAFLQTDTKVCSTFKLEVHIAVVVCDLPGCFLSDLRALLRCGSGHAPLGIMTMHRTIASLLNTITWAWTLTLWAAGDDDDFLDMLAKSTVFNASDDEGDDGDTTASRRERMQAYHVRASPLVFFVVV